MKSLEELANEYANRVSVSHRIHATMYLGQREFSSVKEVAKAAFIDGYNARDTELRNLVFGVHPINEELK